ncbi:MAG TPA: hypothetical protein VJX71_07985 [Methylomirabilota bacterium]|nr:hypothetical protein [Methylomirabilota bacterium]
MADTFLDGLCDLRARHAVRDRSVLPRLSRDARKFKGCADSPRELAIRRTRDRAIGHGTEDESKESRESRDRVRRCHRRRDPGENPVNRSEESADEVADLSFGVLRRPVR